MREEQKKEKLKLRENEKKREKRGKEKRRKKENETVTGKRRCVGFVSVEAFEIFSQGEDLVSCGDISWEDLLEEPEDLSGRELVSGELVRVVPDVTDVLVSPSSVVTELCDVSPCCSDRDFCGTAVLFFLQKAHLLCEGPRKVRSGRKRMECERKNNHREDKTVSGNKFQCEGRHELPGG